MKRTLVPVVHSACMRVSVVIPCHNSLGWLPMTMSSVLAQDFGDFDVILVDDGGSDDLAGWASTVDDERVRVVAQSNGGVASARNRGVSEAGGELIAFLDSDDLWEPTTLSSLVAAHDRAVARSNGGRTIGLTYGWHDVIDAEGRSTGRAVTPMLEGDVWDEFVVANVVAVGSALVPSFVFAEIGGPLVNHDRFAVDVEDWEFWIRIAARYDVALAPEMVLHVRRHGTNSTGAGATASLESAYELMQSRVFDPDNAPDRDESVLATLRRRSAAHAYVILAWHSINFDGDTRAAGRYLRSAREHGARIGIDSEYLRARLALASRRLVSDDWFDRIRALSRTARRPAARRRTRRG